MSRALSPFGPGVLRFALAWVVVLTHTCPLKLGGWAVYVFFVLSGYWITAMWSQKYSLCKAPYATFLTSRYWRIIPLFLVCNAIGAAMVFLAPHWFPANAAEIYNPVWWVRAVLLAGSSKQFLLLPPAWSLDIEMIFYIIAPFLVTGGLISSRWIPRSKMPLFLASMTIALLCVWLFTGIKTGRNLSCFFAGALAFECQWRPSRKMALSSAGFLGGAIALGLCFPTTRVFIWSAGALPSDQWMSRLCLVVAATFVFIPFAIHTVYQSSSKLDRTLGDMAYAVYISHYLVIFGFENTFRGSTSTSISLLIQYTAILLSSFLLYRYVEGPSERLRRNFVSSRKKQPGTLAPKAGVLAHEAEAK